MPLINDPAVCAEIAALHDAYENALAVNDVAALVDFFWSSPQVVRFGVTEHLYGTDAITSYRQNHQVVFANRKLLRRTIVTLGAETASVMCEISQTVFGVPRHSRQSQVWVRFPEIGWKIIAAHVSNAIAASPANWETYVDQAAVAVGLPLAAAHRAGVAGHLARAAAIAAPLLDFPLPGAAEPATVFTA
jgi:hypothetical protein